MLFYPCDRWLHHGGGGDDNYTSAMDIPLLNGFGPIGVGFHSPAEYLKIASLKPRIRLLRRVVSML